MVSHKLRVRRASSFFLLILFCFFYRFLAAGKNPNNAFAGIADFTVNTTGYLSYLHTATFYTLFFVTVLSLHLVRPSVQNLARLSRGAVFAKNTLTAAVCAAAFSVCFSLPHLCFMGTFYSAGELRDIHFPGLLLLQTLAYALYYLLTGLEMITVYYMTRSLASGQLVTVGLNMLTMFAYRLLGLRTPIEATLVFTKALRGGLPWQIILLELTPLVPAALCLLLASFALIKRGDIL